MILEWTSYEVFLTIGSHKDERMHLKMEDISIDRRQGCPRQARQRKGTNQSNRQKKRHPNRETGHRQFWARTAPG